MDENKKQILEKYKLTEEEHKQYYEIIKRIYTGGKIPVENPIAVIIGGQTGAGKSGVIGYSTKMFKDENVIIINSDEIKPFHPKSEEIAKLYPQMYTEITDQESNTWTSQLFEELRREKYNIIFEGTMKNNRIADESIPELQNLGYTVVVRGITTCDLESRMSILERYEGQVRTKGWGRLVTTDHHNQTYEGMPNTIEYIEDTGKYDILEIFARGDLPDQPINIYSAHNSKSSKKIDLALKGKSAVSKYTRRFGYKDAKTAVWGARQEEYDRVIPTLHSRIKAVLDSMNTRKANDGEKGMVLDLMKEYQTIIKKSNKEFSEGNENESR